MKKFKHRFEDILIVLFSKFKRRRTEIFKMTKKAANFYLLKQVMAKCIEF